MTPTRGWRVDLALTLVLALVVLGPLFTGPGYWLVGDMVFVPHQPWKSAWLGLDGSLPRAVPMDAVVSALTHVVPGSWVQRAFLLGGFLVGGLGAGRLVREHAWYARAAAITVFCWNPWVHDHLQIGQWAILAGYLALPWVALASRRLRRDLRTGWAPAAVALVMSAVCSPSSGVMAVVVLAVLGTRRSLASWATVAGLGVAANLPWLLPSLVARSADVATDGVFGLFAARGESSLGVVASLLSMGGTWKTSIVAPERTSVVIVGLAAALTLAALLGLRRFGRPAEPSAVRAGPDQVWPDRREEVRRLLALGALALGVALLPAVAGGAEVLGWLGERVPATALLRDSHRFLAPAGLVLAVGLAGAVTWVREQVAPGRESLWAVAGLLVVAPVVLLPSLAWGAHDIRRATYPADWREVADHIEENPDAVTVVLPWAGGYRSFEWANGRAVLDPAPRFLPGDVLIDDRTYVDADVVPSEDPRSAAVLDALEQSSAQARSAALRDLGVRWVVVEADQAASPTAFVPAGVTVVDGTSLRLIDLGPDDVQPSSGPVVNSHPDYAPLVIAGPLGVIVLLLVACVWILRTGSNGRHIP